MERLIYTDCESEEQGFLDNFYLDFETGQEDDFEIVVPIRDFEKLSAGSFIFSEKSNDIGGVVAAVRIKTKDKTATFAGFTWSGFLKNVIFAKSSKNIAPILTAENWQSENLKSGDDLTFENGTVRFRSESAVNGERYIISDLIHVNTGSVYQFSFSEKMNTGNSEPTGLYLIFCDENETEIETVDISGKYPGENWSTFFAVGTATAGYAKIKLMAHHTAGNITDFSFFDISLCEIYGEPQTLNELARRAVRDCEDFVFESEETPITYAVPNDLYSSYDILHDFCKKNGYKFKTKFLKNYIENGEKKNKIKLTVEPVSNFATNEFSSFFNNLEIQQNDRPVNHAVAVAETDDDRSIIIAERFMRRDGVIDSGGGAAAMYYSGKDKITQTVTVSGEQVLDSLDAILLDAQKNAKSVTVEVGALTADVGDLVGGKDESTGLSAVTTVKSKIVKMTQHYCEITLQT